MSCEQTTGPSEIEVYTRIKNRYLEDPGEFVELVTHDAACLAKTGIAAVPFLIKKITEGETAMMSGVELERFIGGVQGFLGTDRGKRYDLEKCQKLLGHLKTIAEVRKASVSRTMVLDL